MNTLDILKISLVSNFYSTEFFKIAEFILDAPDEKDHSLSLFLFGFLL